MKSCSRSFGPVIYTFKYFNSTASVARGRSRRRYHASDIRCWSVFAVNNLLLLLLILANKTEEGGGRGFDNNLLILLLTLILSTNETEEGGGGGFDNNLFILISILIPNETEEGERKALMYDKVGWITFPQGAPPISNVENL